MEETWKSGMKSESIRHGDGGSSTKIDFNNDGSVRSRTTTDANGNANTEAFRGGEYFEAEDGSIRHNP